MESPIIFFDGNCGLCHGVVKFVAKHDRQSQFKFAPQNGASAERYIGSGALSKLPDSLYVVDGSGRLYLKAFAVDYILNRLGGKFKFLEKLSFILPWKLKNQLYDFVARNRRKLFQSPESTCPITPEEMKGRFLD